METGVPARLRLPGFFLCVLVCLFSLAAKTSLYRPPHAQIHSLTSSKMWKGDAPAKTADATSEAVLAVAALAFCCVSGLLALSDLSQDSVRAVSSNKDAAPATPLWYASPLAVRPPPSLI